MFDGYPSRFGWVFELSVARPVAGKLEPAVFFKSLDNFSTVYRFLLSMPLLYTILKICIALKSKKNRI